MERNKEIDVVALIKKVLQKPKTLIAFVSIFAVVGVVIALCTPKTYSASVVLAPEMTGGGLGLSESLADMASSFGVDLSSTGKSMDAIYPEIYPEIFASTDFVISLFDTPIRTKEDNSIRTYYKYLMEETKVPFWKYPQMWLTKLMRPKETNVGQGTIDPYKISRDDSELCKGIAKSIVCLVDKKTSVITITISDQDPLVAAIMVDTLQMRLQNYITQYRTKKARTDYNYYKHLYNKAKLKYQKAQKNYANYCDANQDVILESFTAKRDELENEMQMAFTAMNQLNTQVQAADAKIQERTPSFTILSEAKMPHKASSLPRSAIVMIYIFIGIVCDFVWICFLKELWVKRHIKTKKETT